MGKYADLIDGLFAKGRFRRPVFDALVKADGRAFGSLVHGLLCHKDPDIREACAEILSARKSAKAMPFLIQALEDDSLFVRQDAVWAMERIAHMEAGGLSCWLDLDYDNATELKARVTEWWEKNKEYVSRG